MCGSAKKACLPGRAWVSRPDRPAIELQLQPQMPAQLKGFSIPLYICVYNQLLAARSWEGTCGWVCTGQCEVGEVVMGERLKVVSAGVG